ncbi:MAG TPA: RNA ligase family protein [Methylomicrobium sp.]|nr:RNA ligase family protein [Methylomicrobium sp.]
MEFIRWPKTARLTGLGRISEKIDGTNSAIVVNDDGSYHVQSRTRIITPDSDNHGFAKWVSCNPNVVDVLGTGVHFGEWWGRGIQRGYGLNVRRFSLFQSPAIARIAEAPEGSLPDGLGVVPLLYDGSLDRDAIDEAIDRLETHGSVAAPGYARPEGIIIRYNASGVCLKAFCFEW